MVNGPSKLVHFYTPPIS